MARGKKYRAQVASYDRAQSFELDEAIDKVKEMASAKFDETVELSIKANVKSGQSLRDTCVLPHSFQAEKQVLVFAKGEKADEAREAGAAYVGAEDLVEKIRGGWLDFDIAVATPDMMRDVGTLGPILGRRGLMPNPKTQTVTMDVVGAIAELRQGRVEFRADKTGVVHMPIGKVSMGREQIAENAQLIIDEVTKRRPADAKGDFVKSVAISSTMGPGVRITVSAVVGTEE